MEAEVKANRATLLNPVRGLTPNSQCPNTALCSQDVCHILILNVVSLIKVSLNTTESTGQVCACSHFADVAEWDVCESPSWSHSSRRRSHSSSWSPSCSRSGSSSYSLLTRVIPRHAHYPSLSNKNVQNVFLVLKRLMLLK